MKMTLLAMLAVLTMSVAAADEPVVSEKVQPISAVAVSECGKAIVFFITLDEHNMLRLDLKTSTLFSTQPDGTVAETTSAPAPIEAAIAIASSARITSHVTLPCRQNVI